MQKENIFFRNVSVLSTVILSEKMKILKQFKIKQLFTTLVSFGNFFEPIHEHLKRIISLKQKMCEFQKTYFFEKESADQIPNVRIATIRNYFSKLQLSDWLLKKIANHTYPITLSTIFDLRNNNLGQLFGQSYLLTRLSCFDSIFFIKLSLLEFLFLLPFQAFLSE